VPTEYVCYAGMVHGFVQMAGIVTEADAATRQIVEFLNRDA